MCGIIEAHQHSGKQSHLRLQSISIFEYLVELYPGSNLLPKDPIARARVRSIAQYIVSEIQPLQNTRIDGLLEEMVSKATLLFTLSDDIVF